MKKTATEAKRQRIEAGDRTINPREIEPYRAMLTNNRRRIDEDKLPLFRESMNSFCDAVKNEDCYDVRSKKIVNKCGCLKKLLQSTERRNVVSDIVCSFWNSPFEARNAILLQKVKMVVDNQLQTRRNIKDRKTDRVYLKGRIFMMILSNGQEVMSHKDFVVLCRHSYQRIFGIGPYKLDNITNKYLGQIDLSVITHGSKNKIGGRRLGIQAAELSISDFFQNLKSEEGEEHASRQVRSRLGKEYLRDDEEDLLLPAHWTIRKLYERWVFESGWIADSEGGDSSYGSISKYRLRPNDPLWPEGSEPTQIVCKSTFKRIWNEKFGDVKIAKIAKDTCGTCHEFREKIRVIAL